MFVSVSTYCCLIFSLFPLNISYEKHFWYALNGFIVIICILYNKHIVKRQNILEQMLTF